MSKEIEDLQIALANRFLDLMYKANAALPYLHGPYQEAQDALVSVLDILTDGNGYTVTKLCIDNGEDVRYNLTLWRNHRSDYE